MHQVREVLRLKHACGLSDREVARSCGVNRETVAVYLKRAKKAGLGWPLPEGFDDSWLDALLFAPRPSPPGPRRPMPDCRYIYDELRAHKKKCSLTLMQLWVEYRELHSGGYEYTQFCEHYRRWRSKLDLVMRQEHKAGDKMFVDFTDGLSLVDHQTGELIETQLFVGVWGHSNFTYAEAVMDQASPAWTNCHVHAFDYSGVAPYALVPDNLKSGVTKPCLYEPDLNRSYAELAAHYGAAILPARVRKPRDKAKAEAGVLVAQRWILAVLRHRTFFTLGEMNAAIRELLDRLNDRAMRKIGRSRREIFEAADRPAALPLPDRHYEYAEWKKSLVHNDHCIEVEYHAYSVPHPLKGETLDVRLTAATLEVFHRGRRVAAHPRSYVRGGQTILEEHRPLKHRKFHDWTPARMIAWAAKTGPAAAMLVERVMASRKHPEEGYKACMGIMRLGKEHGPERLEAASRRALKFNTCSYRSIKSILAAGLDRAVDIGAEGRQPGLPLHENIRGGEYYH